MDEKNIHWSDVTKKRNHLLQKSDWTQLPDAGLSRLCVLEWREWRREVRRVDDDLAGEVIPAVLELTRLEKNPPRIEYGEYDEETGEDHSVGPIEFKKRVKEIVDELGITIKPSPEPTEPEISIDAMDIRTARKHAQSELEKGYRLQVQAASPPNELVYLYTERLNQALDFLTGKGTSFPLLELLAKELGEPEEQVATNLIQKQTGIISKFMNIERRYIEYLKKIKESGTIAELKKALEEFRDGR